MIDGGGYCIIVRVHWERRKERAFYSASDPRGVCFMLFLLLFFTRTRERRVLNTWMACVLSVEYSGVFLFCQRVGKRAGMVNVKMAWNWILHHGELIDVCFMDLADSGPCL